MNTNKEIQLTAGQRFWLLLKPDKTEITNLYIYAIFNGLIYLALPLGIQSIINFIQGGQISSAWVLLVTVVLVAIIISGVITIFQMRITENLQQKIFSRSAFEFAFRLPRITEAIKNKLYLPELSNRFFETIAIQKGLPKLLISFTSSIVQIVFGLAVLAFYHPFFILFILFSFLVVYILFRFTVKPGLKTSLEESSHKYKLIFWLQEIARSANSFKSAGFSDLPMTKTNKHVADYLDARERHYQILVRQYRQLILFKVLIASGLLAVGGILVIQQQMNIGQFVAAEIIILLMMSSVEKLILNMSSIYDVLTALEKIGHVTDLELDGERGSLDMNLCTEKGIEIHFEKFELMKQDNNANQLQISSLLIRPGQKLLMGGEDEDNRELLFKILAGNSDRYQGLLTYCGLALKTISFEKLKMHIGVYDDQETLFDGTVFENIGMGRENIGLKEVINAARAVRLDGIIQSRIDGYNTKITAHCNEFSLSTRKKILLARAIVHRPNLLAIDFNKLPEDPELRKKLSHMLNNLNDCTLVAIASDANLITGKKLVVNTQNGKIEEIN